MIVPDLIEPFIGWRVWRVIPMGADLALASLYADNQWPQQAAAGMTACEVTGDTVPCPPDECADRHACGIHASKTLELACSYLPDRLRRRRFEPIPMLPATGLVYGQVSLWGEVEEGELSYRAEWAYPSRIIVPVSLRVAGREASQAAYMLRDGYGVPVELSRYVDEVAA